MEIDKKDKDILNVLLENSRLSYRRIAKKVKISVATAMHRVKALENEKIIKQYSAILNYDTLGYDIPILIEVQVARGQLVEVERRLAQNPHVVAVYDITGGFDVVVIAKFKNRKQMDMFIKEIQTYDYILRTNTRLILQVIKEKPIAVE